MANSTDNDFSVIEWVEILETRVDKEPKLLSVIYVVLLCIIFVVSLIGNSLTCIVIYYNKSMHTLTNYYLFNLAISDLMLTFAITWDIFDLLGPSYECSPLMCKVTWFSMLCVWNSGILIMTALSVERYFAICHPLKLKSSPEWHRVMKIIALLWLVAIAESLPEWQTVRIARIHQQTMCLPIPTPLGRVLHGFQAILSFAVPLFVMMFVYSTIVLKVNAKTSNINDKIFNHRDPRGKVNKLIVAMTASFLVCGLPFFIARVLICVLSKKQFLDLAKWFHLVNRLISLSSWLSVVLNPILFSLVSTKFRTALKTLLDRKQ